ncbi:MAG: hypothetical protein PHP57_05630 [Sideroxydans sp.]|nr:hypothetical protein [Sideroxydans sp.]
MKSLVLGLCLFSSLTGTAVAAAVRVQGDDVYYVRDDGQSYQLTNSKNNGGAVLSPDGQRVAYLHIKPRAERDHELFRGNEIWLVDVTGSNARRLVKTYVDDENAEANLAQFNSLAFSVAGDHLYFLSAAWMTSDALHVLDLSTGKQRYLVDGNSVFVIPTGHYAEHLIVEQRHYLEEGGATNYYWLLTPAGKEVKMAGKTWKQAMQFVKRKQ